MSKYKLLVLVTGSKSRKQANYQCCRWLAKKKHHRKCKLNDHCIPRHEFKAAASCTFSHTTAAYWGEGRYVTTSVLTSHRSLSITEVSCSNSDSFICAPCLWSLFSLPISFLNPDEYLSLVPLTNESPFLQVHLHELVLLTVLPSSRYVHASVDGYRESYCTGEPLFPSSSPPTHFASHTINMNVKKLKNNQYIFQVSCSCLFNISCYI